MNGIALPLSHAGLEPVPGRIAEIRRRDTDADWEVALEAPVNRVLPVARAHLKRLWAAFGEA